MTQEMYEKVVDTYPFALMHIFYCYRTQKECEKAVDTCHLDYVPDYFKTQEIYEKAVFKEPLIL